MSETLRIALAEFRASLARRVRIGYDTNAKRQRGHAEPRDPPGKGEPIRENWWAERGSRRYINDEHSLEAAILYVRDAQDRPR